MADFDAFESGNQAEDPAADFLAKEQQELAEIEGEDFGFSQPTGETQQVEQTGASINILFCLMHIKIYRLIVVNK